MNGPVRNHRFETLILVSLVLLAATTAGVLLHASVGLRVVA